MNTEILENTELLESTEITETAENVNNANEDYTTMTAQIDELITTSKNIYTINYLLLLVIIIYLFVHVINNFLKSFL